jgi:hypothetical protein
MSGAVPEWMQKFKQIGQKGGEAVTTVDDSGGVVISETPAARKPWEPTKSPMKKEPEKPAWMKEKEAKFGARASMVSPKPLFDPAAKKDGSPTSKEPEKPAWMKEKEAKFGTRTSAIFPKISPPPFKMEDVSTEKVDVASTTTTAENPTDDTTSTKPTTTDSSSEASPKLGGTETPPLVSPAVPRKPWAASESPARIEREKPAWMKEREAKFKAGGSSLFAKLDHQAKTEEAQEEKDDAALLFAQAAEKPSSPVATTTSPDDDDDGDAAKLFAQAGKDAEPKAADDDEEAAKLFAQSGKAADESDEDAAKLFAQAGKVADEEDAAKLFAQAGAAVEESDEDAAKLFPQAGKATEESDDDAAKLFAQAGKVAEESNEVAAKLFAQAGKATEDSDEDAAKLFAKAGEAKEEEETVEEEVEETEADKEAHAKGVDEGFFMYSNWRLLPGLNATNLDVISSFRDHYFPLYTKEGKDSPKQRILTDEAIEGLFKAWYNPRLGKPTTTKEQEDGQVVTVYHGIQINPKFTDDKQIGLGFSKQALVHSEISKASAEAAAAKKKIEDEETAKLFAKAGGDDDDDAAAAAAFARAGATYNDDDDAAAAAAFASAGTDEDDDDAAAAAAFARAGADDDDDAEGAAAFARSGESGSEEEEVVEEEVSEEEEEVLVDEHGHELEEEVVEDESLHEDEEEEILDEVVDDSSAHDGDGDKKVSFSDDKDDRDMSSTQSDTPLHQIFEDPKNEADLENQSVIDEQSPKKSDGIGGSCLQCCILMMILVGAIFVILVVFLDVFAKDTSPVTQSIPPPAPRPTYPPAEGPIGIPDVAATTPLNPIQSGNCNFDGLVQPHVIDQCSCDGMINIIADDVRTRYEKLKTSFIPTVLDSFTDDISSCSAENQALVWLSTSTNNGGEDETARSQRFGMAAFFIASDGINWEDNSQWLSERSVCSWFGVTCNSDREAQNLALDMNNLSGTVCICSSHETKEFILDVVSCILYLYSTDFR